MGTKSKPFRIFVEGETISDGRKVSAEMIDERLVLRISEVEQVSATVMMD